MQLQLDTIEEKLKVENEKLHQIRDESNCYARTIAPLIEDYQDRCAPQLGAILTTILSDAPQMERLLAVENRIDQDLSPEQRVHKVRLLLQSENFDETAQYIIQLEALVDHAEHRNNWKSMDIEDQVLYFLLLLKSYLVDNYYVSKYSFYLNAFTRYDKQIIY